MRYFPLTIVSLVMLGCTQPVNLTINEETSPRITLNALYTPTEPWQVYLSLSSAIDTNNPQPLSGAEVVVIDLSNGDSIHLVSTPEENGWYRSSVFPQAGHCYAVSASHVTHGQVAANDCLPDNLDTSLGGSTETFINAFEEPFHLFRIDFGPSLDSNYYEIIYLNALYDSAKDSTEYRQWSVLFDADVLIRDEEYLQYFPDALYFLLPPNEEVTTVKNTYENISSGVVRSLPGRLTTGGEPRNFAQIRSVSDNYYELGKSWVVHHQLQNSSLRIDNPVQLISGEQARSLYTNIEGGLGIFAGYISYQIALP